jgi:hypothetical protein
MISTKHQDELNSQLFELVEYNRDMLKNAEAGNWDKVIEAEILRKNMFGAFYTTPGVESLPDVTRATRELLQINKSLEELAASARKAVTNEAVSTYKGQKAVNAYTKNVR